MSGLVDGATFALDAPTHVAAVCGDGSRVLWARGEPFMLVGPDGVGKTSIAQQLTLSRAGIKPATLLGHTVAADPGHKVLYLALDRPLQAARSMRRMVSEADREILQERLVVWRGALPFDLVAGPDRLLAFAQEHDATTVVIDCLKDVAGNLSDEATGQAINRAMQLCVEAGVETLPLHHQRKAQGDNKKPRRLSDVYGSRWLTAGCGSVVMLWGEAGDPIVELVHLKQPADEVGPLTLLHDNVDGTTTVSGATDVVDVLGASVVALTARDVASRLFRVSDPKRNDIAKAKRRLTSAVAEGRAERVDPEPGEAALWTLAAGVHAEGARGCTQGVHGEGARRALRSRPTDTPANGGGAQGAREPQSAIFGPLDDEGRNGTGPPNAVASDASTRPAETRKAS